jgi:hypothetical protein
MVISFFWAEFWLDFEGMRWNGWLIRQTCLRGDVPDAAFQYDHQLMISFDACTTINRGAPPSFRFFFPWKFFRENQGKKLDLNGQSGAPSTVHTFHEAHKKSPLLTTATVKLNRPALGAPPHSVHSQWCPWYMHHHQLRAPRSLNWQCFEGREIEERSF